MPCYHPLNAYKTSTILEDSGKRKIVFYDKHKVTDDYLDSIGAERLLIPCGQCLGCRLEYSRQWAMRCALEASLYEHNYFVTLTYNDDNVPINDHYKVDKNTGEVLSVDQVMTLVPRDLQLFIKRLRSKFSRDFGYNNIRFYACGEYGPKNMRPHYHMILFNCPLDDLVFEMARDGYTYYRSPVFEQLWNKGFIIVTDFSFETAAYVARYMLKKHKGLDSNFYEENGIYPEFTRCSRRPGIGFDYLDKHKSSIYNYDKIVLPQKDGKPLVLKPPSYFDRLFDIEDPSTMESIRCKRKFIADNNQKLISTKTNLNEFDYLKVRENNKMLSVKKLVRNL